MNPADVAQAALPLPSADVSLIALFWQAHWIVKAGMVAAVVVSKSAPRYRTGVRGCGKDCLIC